MYKWQSVITGEIVENFWQVLKRVWGDLRIYHIVNIRWKYNKEGF